MIGSHDVAHCADYDKNRCPAACYYAELQEEVSNSPELWGVPMTYAHFLGSSACGLDNGKLAKWLDAIESALLRAEQGKKDLDLIVTMRAVRAILEKEVRKNV